MSKSNMIIDYYPLKTTNLVTESKDGRKVTKLTSLVQKADFLNENGRWYPYDVIKEAIDNLQDNINSRSVLGELEHPCLTSNNFNVLTCDGWKKFNDLKIGDYVYSRVNGAMVKSRINNIINEQYNGVAYRLIGRHIDSSFTAPHKIIMDTRSDGKYLSKQIEDTIDNIYKNRKSYNKNKIPRTASWQGIDNEVYAIPGIDKEELFNNSVNYYKNDISKDLKIDLKTFVSFLGLYLAEGSLVSNTGVYIHQKKETYKPIIRDMLSGFPEDLKWVENDTNFYLSDKRLYNYLKKLGNKYEKYIPKDVKELDAIYLEELVKWFQIGDGRLTCGRSDIFSVSYKLICDLHECWVKSGGCCYLRKVEPKNDYVFSDHLIKAENKSPLYVLTLSDTTGIYIDDRFLNIEKFEHNGNIYCLTTEYGNFYMEQNGCSFWTGNCDAKIHTENCCVLLTKLWLEKKNVMGQFEILHGMPKGQMLKALMEQDVSMFISSRGVGDMESCIKEGIEFDKILPGYQFITFDVVTDPSVKGTKLSITESKIILQRKSQLEKQFVNEFKTTLLGKKR